MYTFRCYDLALEFHKKVAKLKIPMYLANQLRRAAASVVCNLKEGSARRTWQDRRRFYNMALASLRECSGVLAMAEITDKVLLELADYLGASLYRLCYPKK